MLLLLWLVLGILIWSFFQPTIASIVFIIFIVLLEGGLLIASASCNPNVALYTFNRYHLDVSEWTPSEIKTLRKYCLYFSYPISSQMFSSTLSGIWGSAFILVPWLLYNHLWISAVIIGVNCFIAGPLSKKLSPRLYLHTEVESKGNVDLLPEMDTVDSICERLLEHADKPLNDFKLPEESENESYMHNHNREDKI